MHVCVYSRAARCAHLGSSVAGDVGQKVYFLTYTGLLLVFMLSFAFQILPFPADSKIIYIGLA